MITIIIAGLVLLVLVAIAVGIVDAAQASTWRRIAAERRAQWEAHRPQPHVGSHSEHDEEWDDD